MVKMLDEAVTARGSVGTAPSPAAAGVGLLAWKIYPSLVLEGVNAGRLGVGCADISYGNADQYVTMLI